MKRKTTAIFSVLSALLLLSVAAVYAHAGSQEKTESFDGIIVDVDEMDEMHDLMTEGFDPELKEQMDILHDGCTSHFKGQDNNEEYMGKVNMMAGSSFNGMMGMGGMMG
jgi:hypothetical protein